ncbi:putative efflux protein MATE family [Firmicutes bacterium CAG:882]|mgnify:FL=1|nr:putative efflux protein MATE family [Firmicutes bacterium CAG:882]
MMINGKKRNEMSKNRNNSGRDLTEGPIGRGLLAFAIPLFLGQLLQQLYNVADAWVVGNFADNNAFAAVSSTGSMTFLVIGFFNGVATGGGVVISKYFGAKNYDAVEKSVHTNLLFGIIASVLATAVGMLLAPWLLTIMKTPAEVMPESLTYLRIYFGGVSTIIMYNIGMAIMRALGDSIHPLYYLVLSSIVNVLLDLLFVAVLGYGVAGAGVATVIAQGISAVMCIVKMCRTDGVGRLKLRALRYYPEYMGEVIVQGLPNGVQNSVISIGNMVVQTNINSFGSYAMSGVGAYSKIEGFAFLPITSMSISLPTFIGQNLGAKKYDRAKKGAAFGIASGVVLAEIIGVIVYLFAPQLLRFFVNVDEAVAIGERHARIICLFFFLLAFSHCAAGVLRGCGKSIVPMITMLAFWCGVRIIYVTTTLHFIPNFSVISWAYPLTWTLSSIVFLTFLLKSDWVHSFEKKKQ